MWRGVAVTFGSFDCGSAGGWQSAVNSTRPNSSVDQSARSSCDVQDVTLPEGSVGRFALLIGPVTQTVRRERRGLKQLFSPRVSEVGVLS